MESQCYSSYWYGLGYGVASNQGDTTTDFQGTAQQNSAYEMPYNSASYLSNDDSDSLAFLENLYLESRDLFKKVVSELREKQASKKLSTKEEKDARAKVFEKLKKMRLRLQRKLSERMKVQTMQRSLSLGSPRTPRPYGEEESSKLQRFKVKTLDLGGGAQGKDGQGTTNKFQ